MFTCHYDTSGSEGDSTRPLIVVGLAATADKWIKFDQRWQQVLDDFCVPYLHTKELVRFEGPFELWKDEQRTKILGALIQVIKRCVNKAFSVKITPGDFEFVAKRYDMSRVGSAYAIAAGGCVGTSERWIKLKYPGQEIRHVVEAGDNGQAVFDTLIRLEGITPIIEPKKGRITRQWFLPFQACDLMAYHYRQVYKDDPYSPDPAMQAIVRKIPQEPYAHNQESLMNMCADHPNLFVPKSSGVGN